MGLEDNIASVRKTHHCLQNISGPCRRITKLRTADRVEVVKGSVAVFCHPERPVGHKIIVHLSRSFGARSKLKFNVDAVNGNDFVFGYVIGGLYKSKGSLG